MADGNRASAGDVTRGSTANHLYVPVVGDGNPHAILRPENIRVHTATELLEQILARDATALSATTLQREQHDPAVQLGHATARYLDALHVAVQHVAGPQMISDLDSEADQLINGITKESAWPALRTSAQPRELDTADNQAAILDWRLDDTRLHHTAAPLPWLPGIPIRIANDADWGPYLAARSQLISDLADQVRKTGQAAAPAWTAERRYAPPADLVADIQVWRAAMQVQPDDLRPTGPEQPSLLARTWQHRLNQRLGTDYTPQDQPWAELLAEHIPNLINDSFLPSLTQKLVTLDREASIRSGLFSRQPPKDRYPTTIQQPLCGGAFSTNCPSRCQTVQIRHHPQFALER